MNLYEADYTHTVYNRTGEHFVCSNAKYVGHVSHRKPNKTGTEERPCNHCCSGKSLRITYSECVSVALVIQQAIRMSHVVISGLPGSTTFFQIISQTARFLGKTY